MDGPAARIRPSLDTLCAIPSGPPTRVYHEMGVGNIDFLGDFVQELSLAARIWPHKRSHTWSAYSTTLNLLICMEAAFDSVAGRPKARQKQG